MFLGLTFPDLLSKHLRQPQDELLSFCRAVQLGVGGSIFNASLTSMRKELNLTDNSNIVTLQSRSTNCFSALMNGILALAYKELLNLHQGTHKVVI